jgi:hypothetical protein
MCVRENEYQTRTGSFWKPGVCSVCLKEKHATTSISNIVDPREGMATAAAMVISSVVMASIIYIITAGRF